MLTDRLNLLRGQSRAEEGRPLPLGEADVAGTTTEHATLFLWAVPAGHGQISGLPLARLMAVGIQTTEAREVVNDAAIPYRSS